MGLILTQNPPRLYARGDFAAPCGASLLAAASLATLLFLRGLLFLSSLPSFLSHWSDASRTNRNKMHEAKILPSKNIDRYFFFRKYLRGMQKLVRKIRMQTTNFSDLIILHQKIFTMLFAQNCG